LYDPDTGIFSWRENGLGRRKGRRAGTNSLGYVIICFNQRLYQAHRLAWFYVYGAWPPADIDHVNGDRADNRIANLRLATRSQNHMNRMMCRNKIGLKGVSLHKKTGLWRARIFVGGHEISLGYWETPEQAKAAYDEAAQKYFGHFWRAA
jgi:HNH endonuclease/AP2 domain